MVTLYTTYELRRNDVTEGPIGDGSS